MSNFWKSFNAGMMSMNQIMDMKEQAETKRGLRDINDAKVETQDTGGYTPEQQAAIAGQKEIVDADGNLVGNYANEKGEWVGADGQVAQTAAPTKRTYTLGDPSKGGLQSDTGISAQQADDWKRESKARVFENLGTHGGLQAAESLRNSGLQRQALKQQVDTGDIDLKSKQRVQAALESLQKVGALMNSGDYEAAVDHMMEQHNAGDEFGGAGRTVKLTSPDGRPQIALYSAPDAPPQVFNIDKGTAAKAYEAFRNYTLNAIDPFKADEADARRSNAASTRITADAAAKNAETQSQHRGDQAGLMSAQADYYRSRAGHLDSGGVAGAKGGVSGMPKEELAYLGSLERGVLGLETKLATMDPQDPAYPAANRMYTQKRVELAARMKKNNMLPEDVSPWKQAGVPEPGDMAGALAEQLRALPPEKRRAVLAENAAKARQGFGQQYADEFTQAAGLILDDMAKDDAKGGLQSARRAPTVQPGAPVSRLQQFRNLSPEASVDPRRAQAGGGYGDVLDYMRSGKADFLSRGN